MKEGLIEIDEDLDNPEDELNELEKENMKSGLKDNIMNQKKFAEERSETLNYLNTSF